MKVTKTSGVSVGSRAKANKSLQQSTQQEVRRPRDMFEGHPSGMGMRQRHTVSHSMSDNGSSEQKRMPDPPWRRYPRSPTPSMGKPPNHRGPGDPISDPLPIPGTAERAAIDDTIAELASLVGRASLPNHENAIIHPNKIFGYLLCAGQEKSIAKSNLLGSMGFVTQTENERNYADSEWRKSGKDLVAQIRKGLQKNPISKVTPDVYGPACVVYMDIKGKSGRTENIKTVWTYRYKVVKGAGRFDDRPWLTTAFKDGKGKDRIGKQEKQP